MENKVIDRSLWLFPTLVILIALFISMLSYERKRINNLEIEVDMLRDDIEELYFRDKDLRDI